MVQTVSTTVSFLCMFHLCLSQDYNIPEENVENLYTEQDLNNADQDRQAAEIKQHYDGSINNDMDNWSLDEEYVHLSTRESDLQTDESSLYAEQWWRVTSYSDPAQDAEPSTWDGQGLERGISQNLFADYQLLQDRWEEDAIT